MFSRVVFVLAFIALSNAQSIKSCGSDGDLLQNAVFSVSPDPVVKTSPLTITASGTLSQAVTDGTIAIDLQLKALGIIDKHVTSTDTFQYTPGFPAGDTKIVIGPFSLPKLPGSVGVSGTIKIVEKSTGKQMLCVQINMVVTDTEIIDTPIVMTNEATLVKDLAPVTDCGTDADHLKNRNVTNVDGVLTADGDLDEDISAGQVNINLAVVASIFKIPIVMNIPFTSTQPIPKGHQHFMGSKVTYTSNSGIVVTVKGTVKVNDANAQQIICANVDSP